MRVLLEEGAEGATSNSILVLPQTSGSTLETLAGDPATKGRVAEVDEKTVVSAVNAAADLRRDEFIAAKELMHGLRWLHKGLGDYTLGSRVGIEPSPKGFVLDDSEAERIDRTVGLAKGDTVVIGPLLKPKYFLNARGKVRSIDGDTVVVDLDPGDRDRLTRTHDKPIPERLKLPRIGLEKVG